MSTPINSIASKMPALTAWLINSASFCDRFLKKKLFGILEDLTNEIPEEFLKLVRWDDFNFAVAEHDAVVVESIILSLLVFTAAVSDAKVDVSQKFCFFVHF